MTRPADVPENVWTAAQDACCEMSIEYADGSHAPAVARAILAERERAAKACDDEAAGAKRNGLPHVAMGALWCAAAIRAGATHANT